MWRNPNCRTETRLIIDGDEEVICEASEIIRMTSHIAAFGDYGNITVGKAPARTLNAKVRYKPALADIPDMAEVRPEMRLVLGEQTSSWIPKGVFYIDKKTPDFWRNTMEISAYDALMRGEAAYGGTALTFPALDRDILQELAGKLGMEIDPRTTQRITGAQWLPDITDMTVREALGALAGYYLGVFITSDEGKLLLISLTDAPTSRVLGDEQSRAISVGGVLIGV